MTSRQAFFELSSSMMNPKHIGLSPFLESKEMRLNQSPPSVLSTMYEYTMCTRRAINTRIIGFCEPTLQQCVDDFVLTMRATRFGGSDEAALREVLRRRRGQVDVASLPWEPKAEYLRWLRDQGRLEE